MKIFVIPPLAPIALFLLSALSVYFSDSLPNDDAPKRAAAIFPILCIPLYFIFLVINSIDFTIQRITKRYYVIFFTALLLAFSVLLFSIFYRPAVDAPSFLGKAVLGAISGSAFLLVPMMLVRQFLLRHRKAQQDAAANP